MSHDPTIRLRFPPENLYNVCKCILDIVSTDFEFDDFLQKFNKSPLMDEHRQYIYDLSTKCSNEEVMLLRQQSIDKLDLQNSI